MVTAAVEVGDRVWRIPGSRTNAYVIGDSDSICLVDTGFPGDWKRLVAGLESIGRSPADVEAVVLTHAHIDHLGSAERMRKEHDTPVRVHEREAPMALGDRRERISTLFMLGRLWWPKMMSFVANAVLHGGAGDASVSEVGTFGSDDVLDVPGSPVVVFTPGHTSGHCAFHLPDRGIVLTGDCIITDDVLTRETGPRMIHPAYTHDPAEARRSLDVLAGLDADLLLPGHGEPYRGTPASAVEMALAAG